VRRRQRNEVANNAGHFVFEPAQTALNGTGTNATIFKLAPRDLTTASLATSNTPFGVLTGQQNGPRRMQFGSKLEF